MKLIGSRSSHRLSGILCCVLVALFLLFAGPVAAQTLPRDFEAATRAKYGKLVKPEVTFAQYLASERAEYLRVARVKNRSVQAYTPTAGQMTPCGNGDFESGLSATEWQGAYGSVPSNGDPLLPGFTSGIVGGALNSASSRQTLVGPGTDPTVGIPLTAPGSTKAVRIGNAVSGGGAELLSKTFTVTAAQSQISFWYAVVFQDPGHLVYEQPSFWVRVTDATGNLVPGAVNLGNGSDKAVANSANPFFQINAANGILYKNWTCAQINLASQVGKQVTVEFITEDCTRGAHYGYAYIDNFCGNCAGSPEGEISFNSSTSSNCGPGTLCFNYTLPHVGNTNGTAQITLRYYQNGTALQTVTSPVLTSGSSYCFNVNPGTIPGINTGLGGFDFVATANFAMGSTTLAPMAVGSTPNGRVAGLNNDYKIACDTPVAASWCCPGPNLVTNGDFGAGNSGFTSQYTYNAATSLNSTLPGQYNVVTGAQAASISPNWQVADHTSCNLNSGRFLVVNGRTGQTGYRSIWRQTKPVTPGKEYRFCFNVKNLPQCNFDVLPTVKVQMNVPHNIAPAVINVPANPVCNWQTISGVVTIPAGTTSLTMDIQLSEMGVGDGNDLALDDISLQELVPVSANYLLVNIASTQIGNGQYNMSATFPALPAGYGYYWEVTELNATTNAPVPGTMVSNPSAWWVGSPNNFKGYVGTSTLSGAMAPGVFLHNKKYRITFGVWSACEAWRQASWIFQYSLRSNKLNVTPVAPKDEKLRARPVKGGGVADGLTMTEQLKQLTEGVGDIAKAPGAEEAAQLPTAEQAAPGEIATASPTVKSGQKALDFKATDFNGRVWRLADLRGKKNVLLTFFPKCFTGGCANHLSSLRDWQKSFDTYDTQILAVSVDAAEGEKGQLAFAERWQLKFPMIPDTGRQLSMLYGAVQNETQRSARMTVFIDKQGIVRFVDTDVNVKTHGADMAARIYRLQLQKQDF